MTYTSAPPSVRSLEQRIRNVGGSTELALRRRISMAMVVVSQMLPEGAVKGGIAVLKQDVVYRRYGNFFFRM